jgi:hypothetical protein
MIPTNEIEKFNKEFDAFFEIYGGEEIKPKLNTIIRSFAAALVTHTSAPNKIIKKGEIVEIEILLRKLYFSCTKSARREFKRAVLSAKDGRKVSIEKVISHLLAHLPPGERLNILTTVYDLMDEDGKRSPGEVLLAQSLTTGI